MFIGHPPALVHGADTHADCVGDLPVGLAFGPQASDVLVANSTVLEVQLGFGLRCGGALIGQQRIAERRQGRDRIRVLGITEEGLGDSLRVRADRQRLFKREPQVLNTPQWVVPNVGRSEGNPRRAVFGPGFGNEALQPVSQLFAANVDHVVSLLQLHDECAVAWRSSCWAMASSARVWASSERPSIRASSTARRHSASGSSDSLSRPTTA
jgi:hypothetical protein